MPEKNNDWQVIWLHAGYLSDSVEHILVDKDAVSRFQNCMGLSHLVVQDTVLRCSDLEAGVPVHRPRTVWQIGKFIAIKRNGKIEDVARYLFL